MGVSISTLTRPSFNLANASPSDVYFGFVVRLPFRLRVPSPYRFHFRYRNNDFDIWIQNKPIVHTELVTVGEDLWSTVAIIPNKARIKPEVFATIQSRKASAGERLTDHRGRLYRPVQHALNAFITGYVHVTGEMATGGRHIRTLSLDEFMVLRVAEVNILGIPLDYWTEDTIGEIINLKGSLNFELMFRPEDLADFPADKLAGICPAIDRLDKFYFYELAFEANAKLNESDNIGGLLMAVAALEGAHGAFLSHFLAARLPIDRTGEDKKLEDEFIKELGFAKCNKITPYLFMTESDRPPKRLIDDVAKAITYRNDVMHALRNTAGEYKIRTRGDEELHEAARNALQLYEYYRRAFEKAVSPNRTLLSVAASGLANEAASTEAASLDPAT